MNQPYGWMRLGSGLVAVACLALAGACESEKPSSATSRPMSPPTNFPSTATGPAKPVVPEGPHPKIAADKEAIDLGVRWSTENVVKEAFTLKNVGQEPLAIKGVQSSCGCTAVGKKNVTLAPGESWKLPVEIDLRKQQSFVGHKITVVSNDPTQPTLVLKVRGIVRQPITMTPPNAMFLGRVEPGQTKTRQFTVRNNTDDAMDPKVVKNTNETFSVSFEAVKPGKEYKATLEARPPYKVGNNRGLIEIETGVSRQPKIAIKPQAMRTPRIVASNIVNVPQPLPNGAIRQIFVRNNGTTPIKVTKVTTDLKGVTSEIDAVQGGKVHNIKLRFPPGFKLPERGGQVTVHTDDTEEKRIQVLVTAQGMPPDLPIQQKKQR